MTIHKNPQCLKKAWSNKPEAARHFLEAMSRGGSPEAVPSEGRSGLQGTASRQCLGKALPPEAARQGGLHQPRAARHCLEAVSREGPPEAVLKEAWSSTALRGTASRQCLRKDLSRQLPAK